MPEEKQMWNLTVASDLQPHTGCPATDAASELGGDRFCRKPPVLFRALEMSLSHVCAVNTSGLCGLALPMSSR